MMQNAPFSSFFDSTGQPLSKPPETIQPGTTAVIFNSQGEILLEKRSDNGFWGMPGGAVDAGESVQQAIIREVREETGLQVRVKRLVGIYSDPQYYAIARYRDGKTVHYVSTCFECERIGGELRISEESTDIRYFPIAALPENLLLSHRIRIQDALTYRVEPFIR